jgi:ribose transport system permease protein
MSVEIDAPSKGRARPLASVWRVVASNQWILLLIVTIALALYTGSVNSRFWSTPNLINILEQISVLGLVAAGATILIIAGNFDISVGSLIGLAACVAAMLILAGVPGFLAALVAVAVCIAGSVLNGTLAVLFKAPSFIITLAMMGVYHGLALALTRGVIQTVYGQFEGISSIRLFDVLPLLFLISLGGYAFVHVILTYTQIGRRAYAIGNNPRAAYLAGIRVRLNTLVFFAISGLVVGLAAISLLSRIGSALPSTGSGLELRAIGAVVIGGVPIMGGRGSVIGTFFGVLLMGVTSNSLNMLRVSPYYQEMAFGALIVAAVGVSALRQRASGT